MSDRLLLPNHCDYKTQRTVLVKELTAVKEVYRMLENHFARLLFQVAGCRVVSARDNYFLESARARPVSQSAISSLSDYVSQGRRNYRLVRGHRRDHATCIIVDHTVCSSQHKARVTYRRTCMKSKCQKRPMAPRPSPRRKQAS